MSVYVGIDVHRKRSQVAVVTGDGTVELNKNVVNGSEPMLRLIGDLPPGTPVAFEAAFGWGWLAALLEDYGFEAHLVHPLRCKAIASARLNRLGTSLRNRIHAVAADHGYDRSASYWTGPGRGWLAELDLPAVSREIVTDCLAVIDGLAPLIDRIDGELHARAKADPRVKVLRTLPGVGEFTALVMLAEIGDITRFGSARKLASWAGLTPTVRGSDLTVRHGHISKQGSVWLRWVIEPAPRRPPSSPRSSPPATPASRNAAEEEDRHHRDRPQAADSRLPPARRHASRQHERAAAAAVKTGGSPSPGCARPCGMRRRQRRAQSFD